MSVADRSRRMSLIRSRDTKPELALRRALHARGHRYRLHVAGLPGKPDIVFAPRRVLIFVNGCFWHGHKCPTGHIPKSNSAFWLAKVTANRARDAKNIRKARSLGWKVFVVWECQIRSQKLTQEVADRLSHRIRSRPR
ncbi:very short patch repair endonuclease [Massilia agilis]|uniref:Very short patch repair endonuclease n=2 Tax=Massilia agilis TaxID=1811226 RepID=A0ABT2DH06_9BURK|nr:very short patch repair endonuclease [Massilia agilis]